MAEVASQHDLNNSNRRLTKNEKRGLRSKKENNNEINSKTIDKNNLKDDSDIHDYSEERKQGNDDEVEYVSVDYIQDLGLDPAILEMFKSTIDKFAKPEELLSSNKNDKLGEDNNTDSDKNSSALALIDEMANTTAADEEDTGDQNKQLSKRKKKQLSRLSVAELKQLVPRADVVEAHDVTSSNPRLLVFLKAYRNTVAVPKHWCQIRKYLQGKRGVEKIPFQLPEFIADTGIAKIRETILEQEAMKKSKQKARERVRPKMGKIDIDYQVLHDAFFKYQTKPKMTGHGDLYYEGREFEVHLKEKKPGVLSMELMAALGMAEGSPPPWLINMQRYGPPPSYPTLRIPGLNAPLPPGASYGYQPGGWGKPPVDEYGRPLYGDVFGMLEENGHDSADALVDKTTRWGAFEQDDEPVDEESEEEQSDEEDADEDGRLDDATVDRSGLETPSSAAQESLLLAGMETPATIDLRKRAGQETPDTSNNASQQALYHVIQEKKAGAGQLGQIFGSDRTYVLPGKNDVQLSLDPEQLEELMKDKSRLRDAHDQQASLLQNDQILNRSLHTQSYSSTNGMDTEERGGRKRKAETAPLVRKAKEFKF